MESDPVKVAATAVVALEAARGLGAGASVEVKGQSAVEATEGQAKGQLAAASAEEGSQVNEKAAADALAAAPKRASVERGPKYKDPQTGSTWNGWGKAPFWIPKDKSLRDAFLIVGESEAAPAGEGGQKEDAAAEVPAETVRTDETNKVQGGGAAASEAASTVTTGDATEEEVASVDLQGSEKAKGLAVGGEAMTPASSSDVSQAVVLPGDAEQLALVEETGGRIPDAGSGSLEGAGSAGGEQMPAEIGT